MQALAERGEGFYKHEAERTLHVVPGKPSTPVAEDCRTISVERLAASGAVVARRPGASLYDLGDEVAFLDFHSPKQAIGTDMLEMLEQAAVLVPGHFRGLVIGSHVEPDFCVGANIMLLLVAAQEGDWDELDLMLRRFQGALMNLKRLPVPVVTAPYGRTLGGGAEVVLAGDQTVASVETYIGLAETAAGIIPAGGGSKEMLLRALESIPGGIAGLNARSKRGAPQLLPEVDPDPAVASAFETIGRAKISTSAAQARDLGFLRRADVTVPNLDHLIYAAKRAVLTLDAQSYEPPPPAHIPVLGAGTRALLEMAAQYQLWGGYASEHDVNIARKLAYVLTGGDRPAGTHATEEYFLDLEREATLSLSGEPKTQARIEHLLTKGRPLRN